MKARSRRIRRALWLGGAAEDSSVPQPADNAAILLSAFKASVGTAGPSSGRRITIAQMKRMLGLHH